MEALCTKDCALPSRVQYCDPDGPMPPLGTEECDLHIG